VGKGLIFEKKRSEKKEVTCWILKEELDAVGKGDGGGGGGTQKGCEGGTTLPSREKMGGGEFARDRPGRHV